MSRLDNLNYTINIGDGLWRYDCANHVWESRLAERTAHYNVNDILGRQELSPEHKSKWPAYLPIGEFVFLKLPGTAFPYSIIAIFCKPIHKDTAIHPNSAYAQGYV